MVAVVQFRGDEPSVPTRNRVWSHNGGQVREGLATTGLALGREETSLIIGEGIPRWSHLLHESSVLSVLKFDDLLLPTIHPVRENQQDEMLWKQDAIHGIEFNEAGLDLWGLSRFQPTEESDWSAVTLAEIEGLRLVSGLRSWCFRGGGVFDHTGLGIWPARMRSRSNANFWRATWRD